MLLHQNLDNIHSFVSYFSTRFLRLVFQVWLPTKPLSVLCTVHTTVSDKLRQEVSLECARIPPIISVKRSLAFLAQCHLGS